MDEPSQLQGRDKTYIQKIKTRILYPCRVFYSLAQTTKNNTRNFAARLRDRRQANPS
jgi:hypothetical protein